MNINNNLNLVSNVLTSLITIIALLTSGKSDSDSALKFAVKSIRNVIIIFLQSLVLTLFILIFYLIFGNISLEFTTFKDFIDKNNIIYLVFPMIFMQMTLYSIIFRIQENENHSNLTIQDIIKNYILKNFTFENQKIFWGNVSSALIKSILVTFFIHFLVFIPLTTLNSRENEYIKNYPYSTNERMYLKMGNTVVYIPRGTNFNVFNENKERLEKDGYINSVTDTEYYINQGIKIVLPKGVSVTAANSYKTKIYDGDTFIFEADSIPDKTKQVLPNEYLKANTFTIYSSDKDNIKGDKEQYRIIVSRSEMTKNLIKSLLLLYIPLLILYLLYLFIYACLNHIFEYGFISVVSFVGIWSSIANSNLMIFFIVLIILTFCVRFIRNNKMRGKYYFYIGKQKSINILQIMLDKSVYLYHDGFREYGKLDIRKKSIKFENEIISYSEPSRGCLTFNYKSKEYKLFKKGSYAQKKEVNKETLKGLFYSFYDLKPSLVIKNTKYGQLFYHNGKVSPFEYNPYSKEIIINNPMNTQNEHIYVNKYFNNGKLELEVNNKKMFLYKKGSLAFRKKQERFYLKGKYYLVKDNRVSQVILRINRSGKGKILQNNVFYQIRVDYHNKKIIIETGVQYAFIYNINGELILKNSEESIVLYKNIWNARKKLK